MADNLDGLIDYLISFLLLMADNLDGLIDSTFNG
jgi:hypothetical protein